MHYPVAIEWGDENTATGMVFADIPGAISAGDTPEEAYNNAIEAAHIVLEDLVDRGECVPRPGKIDEHRRNYAPPNSSRPPSVATDLSLNQPIPRQTKGRE